MATSYTISLTGSATLNDTDSVVHYGDIKRVYVAGGMKITSQATLNNVDETAHYGDIKRVYVAGGMKITGQATLNDVDSNVHYGDLLKIAFVTLSPMSDMFNILLNISMPAMAISWMQDEVITSAWCCKITRKDGMIIAGTSCDHDITYDGTTYKAATGFSPTTVSTSDNMSTDNLDDSGMICSEGITAQDIALGKYKDAAVLIFMCNYKDLTQPIFILRRGTIGEITHGKNGYTAELRGMMENFSKKSGKLTSKTCRAVLGDTDCKMNLAAYTFTGTVTQVNNDGSFNIDVFKDEDYFSYGLITFTSGVNSGASVEIKKYTSAGQVSLFLPLVNSIELGSKFSIVAGCDGNPTTCRKRFANLDNIQAEFYTPGNNYASGYPKSDSGNIVSEGQSPRRAVYDWGSDSEVTQSITSVIDTNTVKILYSPTYTSELAICNFTSGSLSGKNVFCKCINTDKFIFEAIATGDYTITNRVTSFDGATVGDTCSMTSIKSLSSITNFISGDNSN